MSDEQITSDVTPRRALLRSTVDRRVLQALSSLKECGKTGIPSIREISTEIDRIGYESPTNSDISRALKSLEEKGYIRRDLEVLAQEGGAA
jgi:DNA-binding MarR family transcriptional regulator